MNFYATGQATSWKNPAGVRSRYDRPPLHPDDLSVPLPLLVLFHDALHARGSDLPRSDLVRIVVLGYLTEHRRRELRALLMVSARKYRAGVSADDRAETLPIVLPTEATVEATGRLASGIGQVDICGLQRTAAARQIAATGVAHSGCGQLSAWNIGTRRAA